MQINTRLFGELKITEKDIINFPEGIPGFESDKQYILLPLEEKAPFYYLQSVNTSDLCLLMIDPFIFFPDYQIELSEGAIKQLQLPSDNPPIAVYCILTIPGDFKLATANLMAPIIINAEKKLGLQFIPEKTDYITKHPIFPQEKPVAEEGK